MATPVEYLLKLKDEASAGLKDAAGAAKDYKEETDKAAANSKKLAKAAAGVAAGAVAAAAGFFALNQEIADTRNELLDTATRTGVAAETLAGLKLAAEGSGLEFGNLAEMLNAYVARVRMVGMGSKEAAAGFEALGIKVRDGQGAMKSQEQLLREVVGQLQKVEDPGRRAQLAMGALGEQGGKLMQALGSTDLQNFIAMAEKFGTDVGPEAAKAAGDWQRHVAAMNLILEGFLDDAQSQLGVDLFGGFNKGLVFATTLFTQQLGEMKRVLQDLIAPLAALSVGNFKEAARTLGIAVDVVADPFGTVTRMVDNAISAASTAVEEFTKQQEAILAGDSGGKDGAPPPPPPRPPGTAAAAPAAPDVPVTKGQLQLADQVIADLMRTPVEVLSSATEAVGTDLEHLRQLLVQAAVMGDETLFADVVAVLGEFQGAIEDAEQAAADKAAADSKVAQQTEEVGRTLAQTADSIAGQAAGLATGNVSGLLGALGGWGALIAAGLQIGSQGADETARQLDELHDSVMGFFDALPALLDTVVLDFIEKSTTEGPKKLAEVLPAVIVKSLVDFIPALHNEVPLMIAQGLIMAIPALVGALGDLIMGGARQELVQGGERFIDRAGSLEEAFQGMFDVGTRHIDQTGFAIVHRGEAITQPNGRGALGGVGGGPNINIGGGGGWPILDPSTAYWLVRQLNQYLGGYGNGAAWAT